MKSKKILIECPSTMDDEVAQQCFMIGLKNLIYLNNGSVLISYLENNSAKTTALMGDNGAVLVKFLKTIEEMEQYHLEDKMNNGKTKKENLEDSGSELLTEIYGKNEDK